MVTLSEKEIEALKEWIEGQYSHNIQEIEDYITDLEKYFNEPKHLRNALKKIGINLK